MIAFLGKIRVWMDRAVGYLSLLNFLMLLYIYVSGSPMGFSWYYWVVAIVVAVIAIIFIDIRFIYPTAQSYVYDLNPQWVEMMDRLKKIEDKVCVNQ